MRYTFVYLPMFTQAAAEAGLTDAERRAAEDAILEAGPLAGSGIGAPGGGRKLRVALEGRGKRGSVRVIFYVHEARARVYMIYVYPKGAADSLSVAGKRAVAALIRDINGEG